MDPIASRLRELQDQPYMREPQAVERLAAAIAAIEINTHDPIAAAQLRGLARSQPHLTDSERALLWGAAALIAGPPG